MVRPASTATAGVGSVAEKQARGEYDVFICYHSEDREAVMGIVVGLRERGLLPWIDQDCLRPGFRWMPELERMIGSIPAAAVCIGESGRGPWQDEEIDALLRNLKGRNAPVIPVMLPGSRDERARLFLDSRTRVDFRKSDPDPMEQLVFGITGQNPRLGK
jgi:hypothetical protein